MHQNRKDLFEFMLKKIKIVADEKGYHMPQAFGEWFSRMCFPNIHGIKNSDGTGDGKVDLCVESRTDVATRYHIVNAKFTKEFDKTAPVAFYDEITRFWQAFENKSNRKAYLENVVRPDFRGTYKKLFEHYDQGSANLFFLTNLRKNEAQYKTVKGYKVTIYHLEDVLQYLIDHIEGAMPETDPLVLYNISNVLTPPSSESEVPTSIVFARLIDFIRHMEEDPQDLLFARNVRTWLGNTEANKGIKETFDSKPKEFAYSNNGITILCKKHTHDPGKQELRIENPRVVNGAQTLHSIKNLDKPSNLARVMVKIIEIPEEERSDLFNYAKKRKDIIHKISIRSNMQNPIKRWDLVSNDDFQNDLAKYFRDKKYYYERRTREWKQRKLELQDLGIKKGPNVKRMMQLIASCHYDTKCLGPATAYGQLNTIFEEKAYAILADNKPEKVYELFLLSEIIFQALSSLSNGRQYIANIEGYVDLCLFALICKVISRIEPKIRKGRLFAILEAEHKYPNTKWEICIKDVIDQIIAHFEKQKKRVMKDEEKELSYNNYFKSRSYGREILNTGISKSAEKILINIIKTAAVH